MDKDMKKVSVIGLGAMGSAIAGILVENDFEVTVWNRNKEKAEKLVAQGAKLTEKAHEAVAASPLIITCVTNYQATREILSKAGISETIAGKTLLELSTGTPQEARAAEQWAGGFGVKYLDGAIAATPSLLGKPETPIFLSGSRTVFDEHEKMLKTLGSLKFVGEEIGTAATFDLGILAFFWGAFLGFFNSASIFEAERIPVTELGTMMMEISPVLGEIFRDESRLIEKNVFADPQSSLEICLQSTNMILRQSEEAGTNPEISRFTRDFFQKGVNAGFGKQGIGALIKLMRNND
jgi:3-hydroxyisobutyrate dehydrogenase-like beta-hydroxyacid dehydrogenase